MPSRSLERAPARPRSGRFVALAARWINEGRRLDMQGLADEFRVSRVTLFRRVGSREELISQALWLLTERALETAAARWEAERPEGELHTLGTGRHINAIVSQATGLRRLLDDEPALALRVLTDPRGRVQSGIVAFVEDLLRRDMTEFGLVTIIEPDALAYALVRLGESFLYADVLAARKPDVATADRLQQALVEGILPLRHEPGREWPPAVRTIEPLLADKGRDLSAERAMARAIRPLPRPGDGGGPVAGPGLARRARPGRRVSRPSAGPGPRLRRAWRRGCASGRAGAGC